jgi:hypothetical protein
VEERQQIGHGLGIRLEAGHGGRATTHHLLDELTIVFAVSHPVEIGAHQPLRGQTMAAGAVEAKEAAPFARIA